MKFETKYKTGDIFWTMVDNTPASFEVMYIDILHEMYISCYTRLTKTQIIYRNYNNSVRVYEEDFYPTKEALLGSL